MSRTSRFTKRVIFFFAGISVFAAGPVTADDAAIPERKWEAWTELGGYTANRSYARRGELALWTPLMQDASSLFFLDLRGKLFAENQEEGNAALGYRFMRDDGWNPGFWVGLDRRNTGSGINFDQASFGAELLSKDWDVRVNGYVPLNDRELVASSTGEATVEVIGSSIFLIPGDVTDRYEIAVWGTDAEIGWRVPLERFGYNPSGLGLKDMESAWSEPHHELRLYAGGFYFDHADLDGEVAGPRARAEWRIENVFEDWDGSRLTLEAAWQHDDVREHQIEGGLRLRIPLGGETGMSSRYALNAQERRMTEGLKRDTDIVSEQQTVVTKMGGESPELVEDALSGVALDSVIFVENGGCLCEILYDAGGNVLVVADGGGVAYSGIDILADQTLLGGGGSLLVRGRSSGTLATYTAPGTRPVISDWLGVLMDDHAHLSGVTVIGDVLDEETPFGELGVLGGIGSVYISNTEILNFRFGFSLLGEVDATIRNSTIEYVGVGIHAFTGGTLDIRDSILRSTPVEGHDLFDIINFRGIGIAMTGTLTLANTAFEGDPSALLYFAGGESQVTDESVGNSHSLVDGDECWLQPDVGPVSGGSFTGTIGFSSPSATVTQSDCKSFDILFD